MLNFNDIQEETSFQKVKGQTNAKWMMLAYIPWE
jgi:hypothetical protein